jgi:hypothetical protein
MIGFERSAQSWIEQSGNSASAADRRRRRIFRPTFPDKEAKSSRARRGRAPSLGPDPNAKIRSSAVSSGHSYEGVRIGFG